MNYWCDFIGFFLPNKFLVGYGLDYNEYCREMKHICAISQFGVEKYENLKPGQFKDP